MMKSWVTILVETESQKSQDNLVQILKVTLKKIKSVAMHVMNRSVSIYRLKVLSHTIQTLSRPQYAIFCAIMVVSNAYNEKS